MNWAQPSWMWALPGLVLLALVVVWAGRRHRAAIRAVFTGRLFDRVLPRPVRVRRAARDTLALLGLVGVVAALAEPRFGKEIVEIRKQGVDIVLAVDLSRSMDARDVDPSRLERARREILDLVDLLEGDRVGLVIFSGGAYPRMPLTADYDALRLLVRELDTSAFQQHGSDLGEAIRTALELLDEGEDAGKAVIVLSDGEVHDPQDALAAARQASGAGVHVFGLGIGQDAAPIPTQDGGWLEHEGKTVLSAPSPDVLRDVARQTGGAYVQSVASAEDMVRLYRQEIRGSLQAADRGSQQREVWQSGFQWPLGFAVFCWLLAAWLGDGRGRGRVGAVAGLAVALSVLPGSAWAGSLAEGDAAYRAGRYGEAIEIFEEISLERPTDPTVYERLGAARYRAGDFDGAARAFDTSSRLQRGADPDTAFNAGNAHYRSGRLEQAIEHYDQVLARDPDHPGAARNKEMVLQELEIRRQKQKPPPQSGEGDGDDGGGEDQQQQGDSGQGTGDAPQDGEDGEQGDPQQGNAPGQAGEQGQEGEQDGEATDGASDAQGQGGGRDRTEAGDDGQVSPEDAELAEGEGQGGDPGEGAASGEAGGSAPVTEAQAERLLEGVEEGRPRIVVRGDGGGKPW